MLILSRKKNERVKIGDIGWVSVVAIRNDTVKLAFDFPPDVTIHREEIAAAIEAAGKEANRHGC